MLNTANMSALRVLELYSGIGGMHFALHESGINYNVVKAIDINTNANSVYKHNFPETVISSSSIDGLQVKDLEKMNVDLIVMSPPCQPFTRIGNQKDEDDTRTGSFLHFLNIFKKIAKHPSFTLVENVKGFESSKTRMQLLETLTECGYNYQEMLLTPKQFGIPNCRLRYYLLAKLKPLPFTFETSEEILTSLPACPKEWLYHKMAAEIEKNSSDIQENISCFCQNYSRNTMKDKGSECQQLKRDSSDHSLDDLKVSKRLKYDCSETTDPADSTLSLGMSSDTTKKESTDKPHEAACNKSVTNKEKEVKDKEKESTENDKNGHQAKEDITESEQTNCLLNYGMSLRLQLEDRDLTDGPCLKVSNFLESGWQNEDEFKKYLVPERMFKMLVAMDIVNPCSTKTACFAKRYGKYVTGGGSLMLMSSDTKVIEAVDQLKQRVMVNRDRDSWGDREMEIIRQLKMRYFSPQEVANVMCFPKSFSFPGDFTDKQKYSLLGNSINVHVVSVLIKLLTG